MPVTALNWMAAIVLGLLALAVVASYALTAVDGWLTRRRADAECALTARRLIAADARNAHPTGRNR